MAGPWERYQSDETGPWSKYAAAPPDKYQQAAVDERNALKAKGIDTGAGYTRRLAQGATFGWGDEITAGLSTPLEMIRQGTINPIEGYNYAKARENLIMDDARKNTGIVGDAAEALGGVATGGTLAKAGVLPTANLAPTAGLGTKIGMGMLEGAGLGTLYGAGEGEGLVGTAVEGAKGAGMGALLGGAFPAVAQGASSGYQAIKNAIAGREVAKQAGVSADVIRLLGSTMDADGTLGQRGTANMARAGQEAMLADAGPNARTILDTAIQRSGPGAVQAGDAISARASRSATDLTTALDTALGKPEGVTASQAAIRRGSAGARQAAYEGSAYQQPINYADPRGMALEELVKTRVPASAIRDANALMRLDGHASKQILANMADDGTVAFQTMPDVRQLDYIKRALDHAAQSGDGAGALGGQTALGRAYQGVARELRDTLADLVPEYGAALKTAADPIQRVKAVQFGSKLLSPSMTRDAAADMVRGMTDAERRAAAQGIRSNIDDAMARVTRTVMDGDTESREAIKALKDLSSRANREKLALVIGQDKADNLFREVDRVATSFDLRASVAQNSKTFARDAVRERVRQMVQPGPVGKLAQGEPLNAGKRVAQVLTGKTPERIVAQEDKVYSEIARLLTGSRQQAVPVFQGIDKLKNLDMKHQATANNIARLLTRNQPVAVYPLANLLLEGVRNR